MFRNWSLAKKLGWEDITINSSKKCICCIVYLPIINEKRSILLSPVLYSSIRKNSFPLEWWKWNHILNEIRATTKRKYSLWIKVKVFSSKCHRAYQWMHSFKDCWHLLRHAILSGSHVGSLLVRNAPRILCTQSPRERFVFENFPGVSQGYFRSGKFELKSLGVWA